MADETIQGKKSLGGIYKQYILQVKAYNPYNGIFRENKCMPECARQGKMLTFARVNSHYKIEISEQIIRSLSELSR